MADRDNQLSQEELDRVKARILKKTDKDPKSGCLLWNGSRDQAGFGRIHTSVGVRSVHRMVFMAEHGEIDPGMLVYHTCGERTCVEITHMYLAPLPQPGPRATEEMLAKLPKGIQKLYAKKMELRDKYIAERTRQGVDKYQEKRRAEEAKKEGK